MFRKCGKGAETPPLRRWTPPPLRPSPVVHLRPCEVDGKVCQFHRFVEEDRLLLKVNAFTKPDLCDAILRRAYETRIEDVKALCELRIIDTQKCCELRLADLRKVYEERLAEQKERLLK